MIYHMHKAPGSSGWTDCDKELLPRSCPGKRFCRGFPAHTGAAVLLQEK